MRDGRLDVATLPNGTANGATVDVIYNSSTGRVSGVSTADGSWLHASFNLTQFTYEAPNHPTMPGKLTRIDGPVIGAYMTFTYAGMLPTDDVTSGILPGVNIAVHRDFDNNMRVSNETVNGGWPVAFVYDDDGVLKSAGSMTNTRDQYNGLVTSTDLAGYTPLSGLHHVTDQMTYTPFGEPLAYSAKWDSSSTPIFKIDYTSYDKRGRLLTKTETINGTVHTYTYTYDAADRLYQYYKDSFWQATYTYDVKGNRTGSGWSVDAQDRLSTSPSVSYTYTHNGELRTRVTGGQTTTYTYDLVGNLRTVARPSGGDITYDVDAMGRRVKKTVGGVGVERAWAWDGDRIVSELNASGSVTARFVYASDSNVPDYIVKPGAFGNNPTYRILKDHLGSVRLVVNVANGAVVQQIDYDPWGKPTFTPPSSSTFQPFGFAGGLYDPDTGLVRFGARDYDPAVGRWTAKDPVGLAGGLNVYAYVENDPVNKIDPTGEVAWWAVGAGIGWAAGGGYEIWRQLDRNGGNWSQINSWDVLRSAGLGAAAGAGLGVAGRAVAGMLGAGTGLATRGQGCSSPPIDPQRLHHIFGQSKHQLDDFVAASGGREQALRRIEDAANAALRAGQLTFDRNGVLPSGDAGPIINVDGTLIRLIGGRVVDGVVIVSSASRMGLP